MGEVSPSFFVGLKGPLLLVKESLILVPLRNCPKTKIRHFQCSKRILDLALVDPR